MGISIVHCPMELPGESMVSTIENSWEYPWISIGIPCVFHGQYHGISMEFLEYGHAFVISTMDNPWKTNGCFMYFPWLIHGISSGVLGMTIEKTWVFHENPWISMANMMGFQSMAMLFHGKPMDLTMGVHGILVTMDFQ